MIFDEAEQVFEKHALDVRYSGPAGLAAARDSQLFFFSATFSDYWKKVFKGIFPVDDTSIL